MQADGGGAAVFRRGPPRHLGGKATDRVWAWNASPKKALNGMSPYQVVSGFIPRNPIATLVRSDANRENISPNEYVQDPVTLLSDIYKKVMKAQVEQAKEAESRSEASRVARQLQQGEHVLLRRPPAKLQPRARLEAYVVLKRVGETYAQGDVATGREVSTFTQPAHADRLAPLNVKEDTTPIAEQTKLILEGIHTGRIIAQAVDGRVWIELSDKNSEEMFTCRIQNAAIPCAGPVGAAHGGAAGWGGAGQNGHREIASPKTQLSLLPSKTSCRDRLYVSSEARTSD